MDWSYAMGCVIGLMAIVDPLGAVPTYTVIAPADAAGGRRIARTAALAVLVTLLLFALLGQGILVMFGVTLPAFRAAGGLLILLMGISMLHGQLSRVKQTPEEADEATSRNAVAIVPLAIPLLSGPGAITTVILLSQRATDGYRRLSLLAAIVAVAATVYAVLRLAQPLQTRLGATGMTVSNRIMGLILSAVGVQFIADGVRELFPGLS